jgi:RNA polymerase sigma-70 factor, ECF subfamily
MGDWKDGTAPRNVTGETRACHFRLCCRVLNFMSPQHDLVSDAWRAHRAYLVDLAFRMLGDIGAAEDVVQEAFFRLLQAPIDDINDERGWLIVVTSRLCLDHIKSASSRRERPQDMAAQQYGDSSSSSIDPADRVTLDDEVRLALLVMLERLSPAERVVFVLHDIFQVPFDAIAETVGSRAPTCRQLARRARRKINESRVGSPRGVEPSQHNVVTRAFIEACSNGDLDALLEVLDPDVSGEIDARRGVVVVGADRVGRNILHFWSRPGTLLVAQPVCGEPAVLAFAKRKLVGVLALSIEDRRITKIHVLVQPSTLGPLRAELAGAR